MQSIRQGLVVAWSSFEALAKDLFEVIVNSNPRKAVALLQEPLIKQRLQTRFTLEELASYDFNLSSSLGSIFVSQQDFSDLKTIKTALLPLLNSDPSVSTALNDKILWTLNQQRHLILHRCGIVDVRYNQNTGSEIPIGGRLIVTSTELRASINSVVEAGIRMLSAAGDYAP